MTFSSVMIAMWVGAPTSLLCPSLLSSKSSQRKSGDLWVVKQKKKKTLLVLPERERSMQVGFLGGSTVLPGATNVLPPLLTVFTSEFGAKTC